MHIRKNGALWAATALTALVASPVWAKADPALEKNLDAAEKRAEAVVKQMQPDEKTTLTIGIMPTPFGADPIPVPDDAIPAAGYVSGIPRLNIPALRETDASLGVAWVDGKRKDGATALPSGLAMAASWNPELLREGGAMIGSEARAKGFNVLLAGGANLTRDPRNGRTFEYLSEDPLLTGVLVGNAIRGIQSNHIISTIKHLALNGQETARQYVDVQISDAAARESDLLAFQIGIEIGQPGSVMCAYNKVLGHHACSSDYLLNKVLKHDWGYKGFVMSDWGAVPALDAALNGLDQQSGSQLDPAQFFGKPLAEAAAKDPAYAARVDDINKRVLTAMFANGVDTHPAEPGGKIDFSAHAGVAEDVAKQGIVLLRNEGNVLPLARTAQRILVVGGNANIGVLSGGGSSQVHAQGGPVAEVPMVRNDDPFANFLMQQYQGNPPLDAIRKAAPQASVTYRNGAYISEAVAQAKRADMVIVFATSWSTEGFDRPGLSLPNGQDALIAAVAKANPKTVVVLETGNPVDMPWLDQTAAVLEAWYPGVRGAEAIASVLFGDTNPSGRLPVTFPKSVEQLPRPKIDGFDTVEPGFVGKPIGDAPPITTDYNIEGSDVGYRWFARKGEKPLFPFGYGLSYTSFSSSGLKMRGYSASFTVKNEGQRKGATVGQLYLVSRNGEAKQRLAGFERVELAPGESKTVSVTIDPRILADWNGSGWTVAGGTYGFALGQNAEDLGKTVTVRIPARTWKD
ncbi:glycoside hydrolase family 3 C-terminal domain-containing protein [Novosphingobium beihaiensis]|uniref:Glycoside hydrolase family 3 C-terminal domain-containing protein n=1 Tax=Novosphingobium beihaiensis TaxID=2930389 RepID=A0ABT0BLB4_9SPHN|nr:glycoside hydrolase family 3 C-terminal domain-containing protein [Novosphingobium beihaiensis]MCJ2185848.1 glycoside hydrolase family 3 C-terminal domain-containing protein [Novosphingobium beihaiensis]